METVGVFELKTVRDLFRKLQYDYALFTNDPSNAFLAFNYFVTAEHILDWLDPGTKGKSTRTEYRRQHVILQVCSHLANGAKHFIVEGVHHKSVTASEATGSFFPKGYFPPNYFTRGYFPEETLILKLKGAAATKYGQSVTAMKLAADLMEFWEGNADVAGK